MLAALAWLVIVVPTAEARAYASAKMFGIEYVDAREFGRTFGLAAKWVEPAKKLQLQSQWTRIELTVHRREVLLNGLRILLSDSIVAQHGSLHLSVRDADMVLRPILVPRGEPLRPVRTVVIDAGHGGDDPGKQNHRLRMDEKKFTLDVARRLERLLKQGNFKVVLTRTRDRAVSLEQRVEIAQKARADLFVSIHFNSFSDGGVGGAETFVTTPFRQPSTPARENDARMMTVEYPGNGHDHANALLGYQVHRALVTSLKPNDRGLKRYRYHVLRMVDCPAVLVEAAFLSNHAEAKKIGARAYRQQLAEALAAGIRAYAAHANNAARS